MRRSNPRISGGLARVRRGSADKAKRKLAQHDGVSVVLALVALLASTLFSASILGKALNAPESALLLRESEKASLSAVCAARMIQKSLKAAPDMYFVLGREKPWESPCGNEILQEILLAALNGDSPAELVWHVESERPETEAAFADLRVIATADYRTEAALADVVNSVSACKPTVTIRFVRPEYKMTLRIRARKVTETRNADGALTGYFVEFAENGELNIQLSLGAS